jgi:hypothetical protein
MAGGMRAPFPEVSCRSSLVLGVNSDLKFNNPSARGRKLQFDFREAFKTEHLHALSVRHFFSAKLFSGRVTKLIGIEYRAPSHDMGLAREP